MSKVDEYIAKLESPRAEIASKLRNLITSNFPQLIEQYKWNMPVYSLNGHDVTYLQATKNGINFGLNRGSHLDDSKNMLAGAGKDMRHIKIANISDIDEDYLIDLLDQSVNLL